MIVDKGFNNKKTYGKDEKKSKLPSVLVLTGVHGNEQGPVVAMHEVCKTIDEQYLKDNNISRLTVWNGVNIDGMLGNTRELKKVQENGDLNRIPVESKIAQELIKTINEHDIVIDIHSSPNMAVNLVLVDVDRYTVSITKSLIDHDIEFCTRYSTNNTIKKHTISNGGLGLTLEISRMNWYEMNEESLEDDVNFIHKVISSSPSMYENLKESDTIVKKRFMRDMHVPVSGVVSINPTSGYVYMSGDVIYTVTDLVGNLLYTHVNDDGDLCAVTLPEKILYRSGEYLFSYYNC